MPERGRPIVTRNCHTSVIFCHANGFPGGSYDHLFSLLPGVEFHAIDRVGHGDYPIDANWVSLVNEVIVYSEAVAANHLSGCRLTIAGHSLGAMLALFAAHRRPDLFERYLMLDPPLFNGWSAWGMRLVQWLGIDDKLTPAQRTRGRRAEWPSQAEAQSYFRSKGLWRGWHDDSLSAFMAAGLAPAKGGRVALRFEVAREVAIYRTTPVTADKLRYNPALEGCLLLGEDSDVAFAPNVRRLSRKHHLPVYRVPGGHLFPFQEPQATAARLQSLLPA